MTARMVSWGDALAVELFKTPGGLTHVVKAISTVMGPHYGTRNTFAKLLRVTSVAELDPKDEWRAWLVVTALGHDPVEWGLPQNMAPRYMNEEYLRIDLIDAVRLGPGRGDDGLPRLDSNQQPFDLRLRRISAGSRQLVAA